MKVEEKLASYNVMPALPNQENAGSVSPQEVTYQPENITQSWSYLGDLLERITNGITCEQHKEPPGIPVTRIETISNGVVDFERVRYVRGLDNEKIQKFQLQAGDILFSHINSDLHLGKTAVVTTDKPLLHGMNLLLLRTKKNLLNPYYLHYLLNFYRQSGTFMAIAQHAVNQSSLNQKKINSLKVPLVSINQQTKIVGEIEKQFSRLDDAVNNLKRVKANLKRYKASVLKAAVEGRLVETEAEIARREGCSYETGEQLLQRILETRRSQWQGKGKYKEPAAPDTTDLPELPEGWVSASLDAISWDSGYGTSVKCSYENNGTAVLRIPNVQHGMLDINDLKFASSQFSLRSEEAITKGDMLVIRTNGSKSLIGKAAVILTTPSKALSYASYLIRFRLVPLETLPDWVSVIWKTPQIRFWLEAHAATSAGQNNISMTTLATATVPIPPIAEQRRIVAEVDRHLSLISEVEAQVIINLQRAERLRQSILARAFSPYLHS